MEYNAWFQCTEDCDEKYELNEIIYQCKKCDSLLEVRHDIERLKHKDAEAWKILFDNRYRKSNWPYGSGVWGKKELVCPNIKNENIVSLYEGGSNLFWAERFGNSIGVEDLWIKQCGDGHTGSFKDLGMTVLVSMVKQMISEGKDIPAVACASTGDTSAALSAYCAAANIPSIVFLPKNKVSNAQLIQPISNGALTLSIDTDFDGCMKIVKDICKKENIYLANSMNSLRLEGQKTISIEIVQQFDWEVPDVIVIPGGNLGNVTALGNGFLMMRELGMIDKFPKIVCAQAANANPLYQSYKTGFKEYHPIQAKKTVASAIQIGDPISVKKAIKVLKTFEGYVEEATEDEIANTTAKADNTGLFCCPHTGVAMTALIKLVKKKIVKSTDRVVVISTAHGLKFADFKIRYHEDKLQDVTPKYRNLPVELEPKYDSVKKAIFDRLKTFVH